MSRSFEQMHVEIRETTNPNDQEGNEALYFSFYDGAKVVGTASISAYQHDKTFLYNFEVFEPYRNRGYGAWIIQYLIEHYNLQYTAVEVQNRGALRLYKRFQFFPLSIYEDGSRKMLYLRRK